MDTKLLARIGAGTFVALALTMSVLQLREERAEPIPKDISVRGPDNDRLPGLLRACAAMGELALSMPDCRAAWAEKRRRFLGVEAGRVPIDPAVPLVAAGAPMTDQPPAPEAN